jgi:hypothetical protein
MIPPRHRQLHAMLGQGSYRIGVISGMAKAHALDSHPRLLNSDTGQERGRVPPRRARYEDTPGNLPSFRVR